jgi:hypothetical protein
MIRRFEIILERCCAELLRICKEYALPVCLRITAGYLTTVVIYIYIYMSIIIVVIITITILVIIIAYTRHLIRQNNLLDPKTHSS